MRELVGVAWLFPAKMWPSDSMVLEIKQCLSTDKLGFLAFRHLYLANSPTNRLELQSAS